MSHQGAVLGLCWSDLDNVKLVLGLLDVYVKVMLLRTVLTAICGWARWDVCIKAERRRYMIIYIYVCMTVAMS